MRVSLFLLGVCLTAGGCASVESDWQAARQVDTVMGYKDFRSKHVDARAGSKAALHVDEAARRICQLEWQTARQTDSVAAYNEIIEKYPETEQAGMARSRMDDLEWEKAQFLATREAFLAIGRRIPASKYQKRALKKVEDMDWDDTVKADSITSYREFLRQHAYSVYREEALRKIEDQERVLKRAEDMDWDSAVKIDSIESYREFLRRHAYSVHRKEALRRIEEIDWDSARKMDTLESYRSFLTTYPPSNRHVSEAEENIKRLTHTVSGVTVTVTNEPQTIAGKRTFYLDIWRYGPGTKDKPAPMRSEEAPPKKVVPAEGHIFVIATFAFVGPFPSDGLHIDFAAGDGALVDSLSRRIDPLLWYDTSSYWQGGLANITREVGARTPTTTLRLLYAVARDRMEGAKIEMWGKHYLVKDHLPVPDAPGQ